MSLAPVVPKEAGDSVILESPDKRVNPAKNWCFTLNNYTSENIEQLLSWFQGSNHLYIFQEEIGEKEKTKHLQGTVSFTSKCRPTENIKNIKEIHWEICRSVKHSLSYCGKENTRAPGGGQWSNIPIPKEKAPLKLIKPEQFYSWQQEIIEIIKDEPVNRKIYWYWEETGCTGKTAIAKFICATYDALCLSGKSDNCKNAILQYVTKHDDYPTIIIYNVPRCNHDYISYEGMESIKDGLFYSGKYEGGMVLMNEPHVFVFANEEPNYEKMSKDRWSVIHLNNN